MRKTEFPKLPEKAVTGVAPVPGPQQYGFGVGVMPGVRLMVNTCGPVFGKVM